MVPGPWRTTACTGPAPPRTRGDGPNGIHITGDWATLLPAPAGMAPVRPQGSRPHRAAPRTRGDGPFTPLMLRSGMTCSPHPRGWPPGPRNHRRQQRLLPAPAGMAPRPRTRPRVRSPAPRTRGDGPWSGRPGTAAATCSPHPRGWPRNHVRLQPAGGLLPAPAGMAPGAVGRRSGPPSAPRTRGDGPSPSLIRSSPSSCSPYSRGWPKTQPERVAQTDLLPAPHPRGWPQRRRLQGRLDDLLPAPEGMAPRKWSRGRPCWAAPRTRGDGPPRGQQRRDDFTLLPAPAGMVPTSCPAARTSTTAPRTRGDGPRATSWTSYARPCSPHPRGWSPRLLRRDRPQPLLPAPAGMVPRRASGRPSTASAPRTRGDGPSRVHLTVQTPGCSPHPRGWSRPLRLLRQAPPPLPAPAGMVPSGGVATATREPAPAPAGMVPDRRRDQERRQAAPRTRGDGPDLALLRARIAICSPHLQGWSPARTSTHHTTELLPAPAGLDPTRPHCASPAPAALASAGMVPTRRAGQLWHGLLPAPAGTGAGTQKAHS